MDDQGTLHIRCGSDIEPALRDAGFVGPFLAFADPFCQGPVFDEPQEAFLARRAAFIATAGGLDPVQVAKKQRLAYARLANAAAHDRIVLWFEHDSFDQLILAYILRHLGTLEQRPAVELICIDDFPVEPRFIGLGQLSSADLAGLWEAGRQPVTEAQYTLGATVWSALVEPTPHNLVRIVQAGTPVLPMCAPALRRHLQELPGRKTGLSLTEELTLQTLADAGALTGGALFVTLTESVEPLPFMGDLMYWHDLRRLAEGGAIEVKGEDGPADERCFRLTDLGRPCLQGETDWVAHMPGERHVGGIRVAGDGTKVWRRQG
jgi:hypothetical protein